MEIRTAIKKIVQILQIEILLWNCYGECIFVKIALTCAKSVADDFVYSLYIFLSSVRQLVSFEYQVCWDNCFDINILQPMEKQCNPR